MKKNNIYDLPLYENSQKEMVGVIDDFEFSQGEEMQKVSAEFLQMQNEVPALRKMSFEDIVLMIDACCELKRRAIKAVQGVRNEKFIKAIHPDYFAKSQF